MRARARRRYRNEKSVENNWYRFYCFIDCHNLRHYPAVPQHYASWGFIVIGTEEENTWNGFGAEMSIRHLQKLNDNAQIEEGKETIPAPIHSWAASPQN